MVINVVWPILLIIPLLTAVPFLLVANPIESTESYIIVLNPNISPRLMAAGINVQIENQYDNVFNGFSADLTYTELKKLQLDPRIKFIQKDIPMSIDEQVVPTGIARILSTHNGTGYVSTARVIVMDTGVDPTHPDLNVVGGKNFVGGEPSDAWQDVSGHGTHVAGTIAACDNGIGVIGVSPCAEIYSYRVLDENGSGHLSTIVRAIDDILLTPDAFDVVNLSLGGGVPTPPDDNCGLDDGDTLHMAICALYDANITIVVSAGNSDRDAKFQIPAGYDDVVITVSALADSNGTPGLPHDPFIPPCSTGFEVDDSLATFSNYGLVVDIIAPGCSILSTCMGNTYCHKSGTSMSAPHVTGWVAEYISAYGKPRNVGEMELLKSHMLNEAFPAKSVNGWRIVTDKDVIHEPLLSASLPIIIPADTFPITVNLPFGYTTWFFDDGDGNTIIVIKTKVTLAIIINENGETLFYGDLKHGN